MKLDYSKFRDAISIISGNNNFQTDVMMSFHTTFKVGGPADLFATPTSVAILINLISFAVDNHLPFCVIGKGSNLIVSDKGIRGLVISTQNLTQVTYNDNLVTAACGFELIKLSKNTAKRGLSGLEFACGIPGSVGGAVYMNAGAYEGEIRQVLISSKVLDIGKDEKDDSRVEVKVINNKEHDFSYRHSSLQDKEYIHLSSSFVLLPHNKKSIAATIKKLSKAREDKQPLEMPSAGSVFRRPKGFFTGKLIEDSGLRGFRIGDAAISTKHCGFIVNLGNATAKDVVSLIEHVKKKIFDNYGVVLQTEVKFIGEK